MNSRFEWRLFKLRGVEVSIHLSLVFLLIYIFMMSSSQLQWVVQASKLNPSKIINSPILWGIIFTFFLMISVLMHELAHALMNRKIRKITLMGLGGISEIDPGVTSPQTEIKTAVAGPITSLILGGMLMGLSELQVSENLSFFGYWMGRVNIALGLFNLLPAFPTDGGRILRSLLTLKQGMIDGTRRAVNVSHWVSGAFFLIGIIQFNLLLILIAAFIYFAARSELFQLESKVFLKNIQVQQLLHPLTSVTADHSIAEAAESLTSLHPPVLKVSGLEEPKLIVPELLKQVPRSEWEHIRASQIARKAGSAVDPGDTLDQAFSMALKTGMKFIPVVRQKELMGYILFSDVVELIEMLKLTQKPLTIK